MTFRISQFRRATKQKSGHDTDDGYWISVGGRNIRIDMVRTLCACIQVFVHCCSPNTYQTLVTEPSA